ncbi:MAG: leucine-rich repeat domain-containing protein [Chloroflexota bacterium]
MTFFRMRLWLVVWSLVVGLIGCRLPDAPLLPLTPLADDNDASATATSTVTPVPATITPTPIPTNTPTSEATIREIDLARQYFGQREMTVDAQGRLTVLGLGNSGLTEIPPEVFQFTYLTELTLSDNKLTSLPPEIGQLKNLTLLDVGNNNLTALPTEIGQLTNLKILRLQANDIQALPETFWQLRNLQAVNLFHNDLLELPPQVGQLRFLRWLGLGHNNLRSVPPELGKLTSLDELYLNGNRLTGLPLEVDQLRQRGVNIFVEDGIAVATPIVTPIVPTPIATVKSEPEIQTAADLIFSSDRDGNSELYRLNTTTGEISRLTDNAADDLQPAVSPDGQWLAFVSNRSGPRKIYLQALHGGEPTPLTTGPGDDSWPSWSPDSQQIVFDSVVDGNRDIYTISLEGELRRLTDHGADDGAPAWSPDGIHIAFHSNRDRDTHDIFRLNVNDGQITRLTDSGANDWVQSWSPDGSQLAFMSYRADVNQPDIYTMGADGANQINISQSSAADHDPVWSPDGLSIAFRSNREGNDDIFVMDADGGNVRQLTTHTANDSRPIWVPNHPVQLDIHFQYQGRLRDMQTMLDTGEARPYVFVIPISLMPNISNYFYKDVFAAVEFGSTSGATLSAIQAVEKKFGEALKHAYRVEQPMFSQKFPPGVYAVAAGFIVDLPYEANYTAGMTSTFRPIELLPGQPMQLNIEVDDSGGFGFACPWVYVFDGQTFDKQTEILRNFIGPDQARTEVTDLTALPVVDGRLTIRIDEEKEEISYLDELYILVADQRLRPQGDPEIVKQLAATDQKHLVLHKGDQHILYFEFPATMTSVTHIDVTIVASGYYVPLE